MDLISAHYQFRLSFMHIWRSDILEAIDILLVLAFDFLCTFDVVIFLKLHFIVGFIFRLPKNWMSRICLHSQQILSFYEIWCSNSMRTHLSVCGTWTHQIHRADRWRNERLSWDVQRYDRKFQTLCKEISSFTLTQTFHKHIFPFQVSEDLFFKFPFWNSLRGELERVCPWTDYL